MKKTVFALAALAALGCSGTVLAQSNVTIYGLIDATISTTNNADSKGDRLTQIPVAWFSGNRIGFRGQEDLGSGLKALFKLEAEYVVGTGAMDTPGVLFNRDAWVGMQSDALGRITLGRQNTLARDFAQVYGDAYGSDKLGLEEGGFTNNNNFKQMIFYAGSATGTRYDNGLVWKKVFDNGLVAGLGYQFGEVAGSFANNSTKSVALGYNGSNFVLSSFYNEATVGNSLDRSTEQHKSYSLGGSYFVNSLIRLNTGYFHYTAEQGALGKRKDDAYTVSAKLTPQGPFDYEVGYQSMKAHNAAYNVSGTGTLNAYSNASFSTTAGSGKKSTVFGSAFYHLSKRTELYLAADYMKLTDGYRVASANGFKNQTELAVGMRTRF
ncbi:porin [Glaciimonas sp. CA11.2]|uniref:porin n=1 Tax=Glaciimonas sp. CA11.2 TaxID=3048601 RepID=UPI002AB5D19A|nr:porin [Glaciimonas sp. CA11.2]MDY7544662.1 porin [Glaciimonas sp. CA11.2]MEB0163854.1 porin [Glaciimonas sp. CA11.2]